MTHGQKNIKKFKNQVKREDEKKDVRSYWMN